MILAVSKFGFDRFRLHCRSFAPLGEEFMKATVVVFLVYSSPIFILAGVFSVLESVLEARRNIVVRKAFHFLRNQVVSVGVIKRGF